MRELWAACMWETEEGPRGMSPRAQGVCREGIAAAEGVSMGWPQHGMATVEPRGVA